MTDHNPYRSEAEYLEHLQDQLDDARSQQRRLILGWTVALIVWVIWLVLLLVFKLTGIVPILMIGLLLFSTAFLGIESRKVSRQYRELEHIVRRLPYRQLAGDLGSTGKAKRRPNPATDHTEDAMRLNEVILGDDGELLPYYHADDADDRYHNIL